MNLPWCAGLFVGEGSVWRDSRHGYLHFGLTMLDERSVRLFAETLGSHMPKRRGPWRETSTPIPVTQDRGKYWRVHIGGTRAEAAIQLLRPYCVGTAKGDRMEQVLHG